MVNIPEGYIGLCAYCIINLNSAALFQIGPNNRGLAKDMEGETIRLTDREAIEWRPGLPIPAGYPYLSAIILMFGEDADIQTWERTRLRPYAVTMVDGNLVCERHSGETIGRNPRGYRR